ncbi:hypothetical protein BWR18_04195 [Tateyamaria omphalii]|uniref:Uncharacterized protein n=1 Tax=Tateyamaria omphalii TaxID=299262 RepID=A0A1P8N090_9RHOB|nr:hypothetical protein BWR18_04195 [Tateyamaria omphalii]
MKRRWHVLREGDGVTLYRQSPPRFDFVVQTQLPSGDALRLANQIRQDVWRALQTVRGFSPVIRLRRVEDGWAVEAGGRAAGSVPNTVIARVDAVLNDPSNRARWMRIAGGAR